MNEQQCSYRYEMWQCPRPAAWEGLCRVHAARHLSNPVSVQEASTEGTSHG